METIQVMVSAQGSLMVQLDDRHGIIWLDFCPIAPQALPVAGYTVFDVGDYRLRVGLGEVQCGPVFVTLPDGADAAIVKVLSGEWPIEIGEDTTLADLAARYEAVPA